MGFNVGEVSFVGEVVPAASVDAVSVIEREQYVIQPVLAWRIGTRPIPIVLDPSLAIDGYITQTCGSEVYMRLGPDGMVLEHHDFWEEFVEAVLRERT